MRITAFEDCLKQQLRLCNQSIKDNALFLHFDEENILFSFPLSTSYVQEPRTRPYINMCWIYNEVITNCDVHSTARCRPLHLHGIIPSHLSVSYDAVGKESGFIVLFYRRASRNSFLPQE